MTDIGKARQAFEKVGLPFPKIPDELAARLKEQDKWLFSTRKITMSPYNLQHYVDELNVRDYVVLSHSGHGVNSYAVQYYLVYKALRMFLHLGWGGAYMNAQTDATKIHECFSLASEVVSKAEDGPFPRLTIVGSDFYGSYWCVPGEKPRGAAEGSKSPLAVLSDALRWLQTERDETESGG